MSSTLDTDGPQGEQCRITRMGKHPIAMGTVGRLVADRLVSRRGELGMTQTDLGIAVNRAGRRIGRQAIVEIETRKRRVDVDDVTVLAAVLLTTTAYLMGEIDDPDQKSAPTPNV